MRLHKHAVPSTNLVFISSIFKEVQPLRNHIRYHRIPSSHKMTSHISQRVSENLNRGKLGAVRSHCWTNQYDPVSNPNGIVALAIAENKLMRDEMTEHINEHFKINPWHLTYGEGSGGSRALRRRIAAFVNEEFRPHSPVEETHINVCNGAGSAVSNLCFCMGEPGEGILVGRPLYVGFFDDIEYHAKTKAVLVPVGDDDPVGPDAVKHYETALLESEKNGTKIRALLLSNPHNPLGRPYTKEALEGYLRLCDKYNIHLISDEVYVKSHFSSKDFPDPPPFISVLSFDLNQYIKPELVHVLYAMSKDFCSNGLKIGCVISPFNNHMLKAFKTITNFTRPSQLAEHAWENVLSDQSFLDYYFAELQRRMSDAYTYTTSRLKENGITYSPASVSSFLWVDLSEYLEEDSEDAELALNWKMAEAGVWIAMGASFGSQKHGNYRITFATPREELELGLNRLFDVLKHGKPGQNGKA